MAIRFSFGSGLLLRAMVSLVFLSGLVVANVFSQAATSGCLIVASEAAVGADGATQSFFAILVTGCDAPALAVKSPESSLTTPLEIDPPDEFGVAFEDDDPVEMFRVEIEQRIFGIDREMIGPGVTSKTARNIRPTVSPPLLV